MNIKVLGSGCKRCEALLKSVKEAVANKGVHAEVEYIIEFGDFGLLTSDEVLQFLDPAHGFFPVITIDLGLFFLVAEPENLISDGIVWL